MKIDRSNYEIWLIDWLDGNLSGSQVEQLMDFLKNNPDIRSEFNDFNTTSLSPGYESFTKKQILKKTPDDLSLTQLEYLSIAYLEKDLSHSQQIELEETIEKDPDRKKHFTLIQKTKLSPPAGLIYRFRSRLHRRTVVETVFRISVIGLSAAAAIILIMMIFPFRQPVLKENTNLTALYIDSGNSFQQTEVDTTPGAELIASHTVIRSKKNNLPLAAGKIDVAKPDEVYKLETDSNDYLAGPAAREKVVVKKIYPHQQIDLKEIRLPNNLIAANTSLKSSGFDDERSSLNKFITRAFRERILKEGPVADSPLKGYEIAEAGIAGINKLFGWEMALEKNNDENGDLQSLYFSSRTLKFNAPVRKSEPLQ